MSNARSTADVRRAVWGKHPAAGRAAAGGVQAAQDSKDVMQVSGFARLFRARQPASVEVRWQNGEPVEFQRRPLRRGERFLVTGVREQWVEESPWPFPSPMPIGGDRLSCWRVLARPVEEPQEPPREVVLRMRAGPGVWDLVRV